MPMRLAAVSRAGEVRTALGGLGDGGKRCAKLDTDGNLSAVGRNTPDEGEGRFMLWAHHEGRKDLAIDETAPFTGTVELPHLTVILEILAEGRYTLEISD